MSKNIWKFAKFYFERVLKTYSAVLVYIPSAIATLPLFDIHTKSIDWLLSFPYWSMVATIAFIILNIIRMYQLFAERLSSPTRTEEIILPDEYKTVVDFVYEKLPDKAQKYDEYTRQAYEVYRTQNGSTLHTHSVVAKHVMAYKLIFSDIIDSYKIKKRVNIFNGATDTQKVLSENYNRLSEYNTNLGNGKIMVPTLDVQATISQINNSLITLLSNINSYESV